MANLACLLSLLIVFSTAFAQNKEKWSADGVSNCPSERRCKKIAPYPKKQNGVYTECEYAELGNNDGSRRICSVVYEKDPAQNSNATATNPNLKRCKKTTSAKAIADCNNYIKSRSPFKGYIKGVKYVHCWNTSTPYICKYGKKKYIFCSVQAVVCRDPCAAQPTGNSEDTNATTEEPDTATEEPDTATDDPNAATEEPDTATDDPNAATDDPNAATDDPNAATDDPNAATDDPNAATDDPNATTEDSNATARKP